MNFEGESCPNGAPQGMCLCSTEASNEKYRRDRQAVSDALRQYAPIRIHIYLFVLIVIGILLRDFVFGDRPLTVAPIFLALCVCWMLKTWIDDSRGGSERSNLERQDFLQIRCAVHFLLSREAALTKQIESATPHQNEVASAVDWKAIAEDREARAERNREIRRRAKLRKAEFVEAKRKEKLNQLAQAVIESQAYEQELRTCKAAEFGWPKHPNDVEGLTQEQQAVMMEAWRLRLPPPDFLLND